jgi:protein-arginine kinase
MLKHKKVQLKDACLRAYGALTNCAILPLKELTEGMVKVKLGIALGFFEARDVQAFNDFLADMRPASFRLGDFRSVAALVPFGSLRTVDGRAGYSVVKVQL